MSHIAGTDLGTTNSLIGVMEAGFPILLADANAERLTPSVVHFPEEGTPYAGRSAVRMRAMAPQSTVASIKRFMGRRMGEEASDVSYSVTGGPREPVKVAVADRLYSPEEVSAVILAKLKHDAETALGETLERAVITVPAYFNDAQRNATKKAGELAGFSVERILNEPTAAALAYGLDKLGDRSKVAVYDLGGGTFDISVLELNQGVFQVLSTNGDTRLGGDDIDAALVLHLAKQAGISLDNPSRAARLLEEAVLLKHRLSEEESCHVLLPFLDDGKSVELHVTRTELERLAEPIIAPTRAHCLRALADAHLSKSDLDAVILVGGQTRMPLIRRFVESIFEQTPNISQNPDEAVAIGATIQAGILSGAVQNIVLLDVTPLSLGIETFGGLMNVIIPRNTTIPCKAGEMFTNAAPGQRAMLIKILQGEREMARDNWPLGQFELDFAPSPKGKARVGVQFEIDANGILTVLARDTVSGVEKIVNVSSAVDVSDEAIEKMLEDSLEHAFEDVNERVFTEARIKADELLPAVEKAMERVGSALEEHERALIVERIEEVKASAASGGAQRLKEAVAALDAATQRLAVLLIEHAAAGQ